MAAPCALLAIVISAFRGTEFARPIRLYESMRRMSPYPLDHPYAPSSFVAAARDDQPLAAPHPATAEAFRRHLRSALPRKAYTTDGSQRPVSILEITGCGESYAPRAARGQDVTRIHLSRASLEAHASELRGGKGDELSGDFVQALDAADVLLPFADCSFDAVLLSFCTPVVERPFELWAEMNRVLVQDGCATVALGAELASERVGTMWVGMPEETQLYVLGSYFHYTDASTDGWYESLELSHAQPARARAQPLLVMVGKRLGGTASVWRRLENDRAYRREEEEDLRLERPRGASRAPLFSAQGGAPERWLRQGLPATGRPAPAPRAREAAAEPSATLEPPLPAPAPSAPRAAGERVPVGTPEAEAHARTVRAAALAAGQAWSAAPAASNGEARKKILDVVQQGFKRALEARDRRGEALSASELEVLERLRTDLQRDESK